MSDSQVTIKLTSDEALVLSHWLEKLQMTDLSRVVDDPAVWAPIGSPERSTRHFLSCSHPTVTSSLRPLASGFGRRADQAVRTPHLAAVGQGS
ncbi:hypothetical protein AB0G82_36625 [Streptomyces anulatus]|uniref:hypothetical protein n=1 Tax=Streptomyces anulatus TaxID=1892 RepID=UPI0033C000A8